jgi:hypothetical protein
VAVKAAESSDKCFNYDNWFDEAPTATFKKELWRSLSHA